MLVYEEIIQTVFYLDEGELSASPLWSRTSTKYHRLVIP
jgi:hypothetical protein